jgi:phosphatidylserine/phosphatidylglycerophosphate/cardiolipin synthase-like enzyme
VVPAERTPEKSEIRTQGLVVLLLILWLLVGGISTTITATTTAETTHVTFDAEIETGTRADVEIVGVYPNPVTDGDRGEFIVIEVPNKANVSGWQLRDDESVVSLPNTTVSGRVALSTEPVAVENRTDKQAYSLTGEISLANGGERLRLVRDNRSITSIEYTDAPEGELYQQAGKQWKWQPLGVSDFPVIESINSTARVFVLPDAPEVPLKTLDSADDRILLGGYTFTSKRVASALVRAYRRGVHVEVLVESGPVGGITTREATVLDRLTAAGIAVHVLGGDRARYAYHHAKYAVVDDRVLVMTENWKPSGVGGRSNRGWGVVLRDSEIADGLAEVFRSDTGWRDTMSWQEFRQSETFEKPTPSFETYPSKFPPRTVQVERTRLLVAPDNAGRELVDLMDNATRSLRVVQVSIEGSDGMFTQAALRAAQRGVDVRILLSSAWYVEEKNRALTKRLNRRAAAQNLSLEVRLTEPNGRFEKIHAKGVIIDGDQVVVGSLNWNPYSARENREVVVVLSGERVGSYYSDVFDADWQGETGGQPLPLPVGIIAALGIAILLALVLAKTIDFER